MEIKGFMGGMFFLIGLQLLLPLLGVTIAVAIPLGTYGTVAAGIICLVISYYLLRNV